MSIILGFRFQTIKKYGPIHKNFCEKCKSDEYWQLYTRRTWITMFSIPLIPYVSEYFLLCPSCSYGIRIEYNKFNKLKEIAKCNIDFFSNQISKEQYESKINILIYELENINDVDQSNIIVKTEVQKNYLRQIKEIEEEMKRKALKKTTI